MASKSGRTENERVVPKRRVLYVAVALIIVIVPTVYFLSAYFNRPGEPRAAIIDQLGSSRIADTIRYENQTFVNVARDLLRTRFLMFDYYSDNATVDQYRHLAAANYKLIVWRAHSALNNDPKYVAISTVERYASGDYDLYLDNEQLTLCNITGENDLSKMYLGITPRFIKEVMNGRFDSTVIVFMSCNGLKPEHLATAEAFREKGVKAFISWDNWVSSYDNDHATSLLLRYLIDENDTVRQAVEKIPAYTSEFGLAQMLYSPSDPDVGEYRIPTYVQNENSASAEFVAKPVLKKKAEATTWCTIRQSRLGSSSV